jgi:hypothetical protein
MKKDLNATLSSIGIKVKHTTWRTIAQVIGKEIPDYVATGNWKQYEPTVADILAMDLELDLKKDFPATVGDQLLYYVLLDEKRTSGRIFQSIRRKLLSLGYSKKDGPFLYHGTTSWRIDQIVKKANVSRKEAEKALRVAVAMGWQKPPLSE